MRNVFKVFKRDIKSIFTNPIALLIIVGLCIIPSLYAWINIKAAWDPYSNTGTLPVAVINEDKGATLAGKNINIGDGIIDELHSNDKIGWKFVSKEEGNVGLVDGKYYAMIEIPANFSESLASITTENPTKADIIYKVNTKVNPVANKITEVAEQTLVTQIKTSFVESVNSELFTKLNAVGDKLNENKQNIINLKESIININNNMGLINNVLNGVSSGATSLGTYINTVKTALPAISSSLSNVQSITVNTSSIIDNTNSTLNSAFNNISVNLSTAKANVQNVQNSLAGLNTDNVTAEQAKATIANAKNRLTNVETSLSAITTFLEKINGTVNNKYVTQMITNVTNIKNSVSNQIKSLGIASGSIDQAGKVKESVITGLTDGTNSISNSLGNAIDNYNNNTKGQLQSIGSNLSNTTKTAAGLINEANGLVGKVQDVVNSASSNTQMAARTAASLKTTLNQFTGVISELAKNLGSISNDNLDQMIAVLQGNPAIMGNFISTPFNIHQESIFKIDNYGSGMTPIYTVLALWVGSLLLTSLLKTNPPNFEGLEKISIRERYFGKLLTFMVIAIIQAIIVALGDKYLLGVQAASVPLLVGVSIATAITFSIIIFTLVSIFGNFGKAIAIVLMVIQIAGTGGTYPIQVLPLFFRIIEPLMPFSYAVNVFREAIAGPIFSHVASDLIALATFSIIFLLLGYFFKPKLHGKLTKFEEKFEESGIGE
ncbi:YhgE/Pip domain-containing protein [uncultured Clostridium sp.]|jgi:putative membrane protein|uniref:YhgE/Pip domain-containing protein n=1 Tax=uncultured Clostridium sp. TaxID=59620 RepID=UPI00261015F5|nr:YhgE/Pip domain-containing protein [uncultured Clostridium sp.]